MYQSTSGSNRLQGYAETMQVPPSAAQTTNVTYVYDATGALTKKGDSYLHYAIDGRIAQTSASASPGAAQAVNYTYNSLAQRILKRDTRAGANVAQQTLYAEDGIGSTVLGQYSSQRSSSSASPTGEPDSTEIIYLPTPSGPMPIAAQINGRLYAIDTDHLNTPRRLTNEQGQVAWQWLISGFGEVQPTTGAKGYEQAGTSTSYSEPVSFNLRYPGQVWDDETGLSYNLHRYYDVSTGRYTQADPIGLEGGWNRFGYVGGDPINSTDRLGLAGDDHSTGQWKQCSKGCRIRIDFFLVDGVKVRHLHWECKKAEGVGGEFGGTSHGGTLEDAPKHIKECAREHGFEPDPVCPPEPSLFERIRGAFSTPPIYDPRTDRWLPAPRRPPVIIPLPGRGPVPVP